MVIFTSPPTPESISPFVIITPSRHTRMDDDIVILHNIPIPKSHVFGWLFSDAAQCIFLFYTTSLEQCNFAHTENTLHLISRNDLYESVQVVKDSCETTQLTLVLPCTI